MGYPSVLYPRGLAYCVEPQSTFMMIAWTRDYRKA